MLRGLKLAHFVGLVLFLGSILTFIVISALSEGASLEDIAFGRRIISTGTDTDVLTLPGMWVQALTGVCLGYRRYGVKQRFFQLKLLLMTLIVVNAYVFIAPAVTAANQLAIQSLAHGALLPAYRSAYLQESMFGALNIALAIAAAVVGVWRIGGKPTRD